MDAEQILKELKNEFVSLKTEDEKSVFDLKMRQLVDSMSSEERKAFRKAFLASARQTFSEAKNVREEVELKLLLRGVDDYLSLSKIAQDYFGKSRGWLYQRINGATVNSKPAQFTREEQQQLANALMDISKKIQDTAERLSIH